jgi:hypothetical protein
MSMVVALPRLRRMAWAFALGLLAAAARADELSWSFNGKVSAIQPLLNQDVQSKLGALGVHVGTPATATLVIETSATGTEVSSFYDFVQYDMAVVDVHLEAGNWEAHFAPPAGSESINFVRVADDQQLAVKFDSWMATALGVDTQATLAASPFEDPDAAFGTFSFQFMAVPPKASSNTQLVQELSGYKQTRTASFTGLGGALTLLLDKPPEKLGKDPVAIAKQGELKAAAKFCRTAFDELADVAAGKSTTLLAQEALQHAGELFLSAADAAMQKALDKTGSPPPGWSELETLKDALLTGCVEQAAPVTAGLDPLDEADAALRAKLLRAMGRKLRTDLQAEASNAMKPAADKLVKKEAASKAKLLKAFEKAIDVAAAQGVVYDGPPAEAVAESLYDFAKEFTEMTATDFE